LKEKSLIHDDDGVLLERAITGVGFCGMAVILVSIAFLGVVVGIVGGLDTSASVCKNSCYRF